MIDIPETCIRVVCEVTGVDRKLMESECRRRDIAWPRRLCWWLIHENTALSWLEVAGIFGNSKQAAQDGARKVKGDVMGDRIKAGQWRRCKEMIDAMFDGESKWKAKMRKAV